MKLNPTKPLRTLALGLVVATLAAAAPKDRPYLEHLDERGNPRPEYARVLEVYGRLRKHDRKKIEKKSVADFDGDNALLPIPRVITREVFDSQLRRGTDQRARALRAFLQDHYSGKKRYLRAGVIPEAVVDRALQRAGEQGWEGLVPPELISFWYGPDVVRDSAGKFRVVEDNPGFIGGVGDLKVAREALLKYVPGYEPHLHGPDPMMFYRRLLERYRARAIPPGSKVVYVQYDKEHAGDAEEKRLRGIFEAEGIETVVLHPKGDDARFTRRLVTTDEGVYLETRKPGGRVRRERVGLVINHTEIYDLDPRHPAARQQKVVAEARELLDDEELDPRHRDALEDMRSHSRLVQLEQYIRDNFSGKHGLDNVGVPGLLAAFSRRQVAISSSPGTEVIGDKELYIYVDDLVRFYLGEEPILTNIRAQSLGREGRVNRALFGRVFADFKHYVIKRVDGRGGSSVWVGPKTDRKLIPELKKLIEAEPEAFIAQEYAALSQLDGSIVDLRLITDVGPADVLVSETPWGRAAPANGDGKVNISLRGRETTVIVVDPPAYCDPEKLLLGH